MSSLDAAVEAMAAAQEELGEGRDGDEILIVVTRGGRSDALAAVGGTDEADERDVLRLLLAHSVRVLEELSSVPSSHADRSTGEA